jgi:DNA processing protein
VNRPLYNAIQEMGAIVSELPCGAPPRKEHFPARNRIIAALSLGVVLVQARSEKSGAMITVERALEYGREVFAVPGDVRSELTTGPLKVLREGATLCAGAADVVGALQDQLARASPRFGGPAAKLTAALAERPGMIETVAARAGLELPAALRAAGRLELAGVIVRDAAGVLTLAEGVVP